jgi:hypothetical protein
MLSAPEMDRGRVRAEKSPQRVRRKPGNAFRGTGPMSHERPRLAGVWAATCTKPSGGNSTGAARLAHRRLVSTYNVLGRQRSRLGSLQLLQVGKIGRAGNSTCDARVALVTRMQNSSCRNAWVRTRSQIRTPAALYQSRQNGRIATGTRVEASN